jgi:HD-like signal output (HDOD) protein
VFRRAPRRYDAVLSRLAADPDLTRCDAEHLEFGVTHAEVGSAALSVMRFPAEMVEAIGQHHTEPALVTSRLGRVLVAADAIALEIEGSDSENHAPLGDALEALEMPVASADNLLEEVRSDQDNLSGFLTVRG